jgi:hypothetical protein
MNRQPLGNELTREVAHSTRVDGHVVGLVCCEHFIDRI